MYHKVSPAVQALLQGLEGAPQRLPLGWGTAGTLAGASAIPVPTLSNSQLYSLTGKNQVSILR